MAKQYIEIRGANEHNLKDISVDIPRSELAVPTELSGSNKSSPAFDTIHAEGQRHYMESLSSYARQSLGQMEKPDVENIKGPSPAISIDQESTNRDLRSIVGAVTEIYDYMRLLYARIGIPHCPKCGKEIHRQTIDQMVDQIMSMSERTRTQLLAPVVRGREGEHVKVLDQTRENDCVRVRIGGSLYKLSEGIRLEKNIKHNIEIMVDRLIMKEGTEKRLTDSIETVMALNGGLMMVDVSGNESVSFNQSFSCPDCTISVDEVEPRGSSFNNPFGAYPECFGLKYKVEFDGGLMIPDKSLSIDQGAVVVMGWQSCTDKGSFIRAILKALSEVYDFGLDTPSRDYPKEIHDILLYGTGGREMETCYKSQRGEGIHGVAFEGLAESVNCRYKETFSETSKAEYETYVRITPHPAYKGQRLRKESLVATVGGMSIYEATDVPIIRFKGFMSGLKLTPMQEIIGASILKGVRVRMCFLVDMELDYLSLSRATGTLSGREAQRIRLVTQIGSGLMDVAYILDEPSTGLHQQGNNKFLKTLAHLRDLGNSVLVVEHDEDTMRVADCIMSIGPGAGEHGGKVITMRTAKEIMKNPDSITKAYLSGHLKIPIPAERRKPTGWITIRGAAENSSKNISVDISLGVMTCVTGVSGSGKSSLVNEVVYESPVRKLNRARTIPGRHKCVEDVEQLDEIIDINQSPIGRTPRSNPVTYTGVFDFIRDLFVSTPDTKARGYDKRRFNFSVKGGRCEACSGSDIIKIEMHFLPDVYVPYEVCGGRWYNREALGVKYKGKNIYGVLNITVKEALKLFENMPSVTRKIQTLYDVGLGCIRLGQPSTELFGGEAQRIKLATELSRRDTGRTIYIPDEPTTGLHFVDIHRLTDILHRLSEDGSTVVVIEHNLDVIKTADYIIDISPEGGDRSGTIIAKGTPERMARYPVSYTGMYVKRYLN